jgi:hypothetical protein
MDEVDAGVKRPPPPIAWDRKAMQDLIMMGYEHIYVDFIILVYNSFFRN